MTMARPHFADAVPAPGVEVVRPQIRIDSRTWAAAQYWATGGNTGRPPMSTPDYVAEAIAEKVARDCGEFVGEESMLVARMGELIDAFTGLRQDVHNSMQISVRGFDTLVGLTRGDNFLGSLDDDIDSGVTSDTGLSDDIPDVEDTDGYGPEQTEGDPDQ